MSIESFCPNCNSRILNRVQIAGKSYPVLINLEAKDGEPVVKTDWDAVPQEDYKQYYQCPGCKHILKDDEGNIVSDHFMFKEWVKTHTNFKI